MKLKKIKLKKVKTKDIKPYWRNPRKNELAVDPTKKSIEQFGYNVPITVDKENVIVTGHTRFQALSSEVDEIEVVDLSHLSDEQIKQFRIADNKTSEFSVWDDNKLMQELRELTANLDQMQPFFSVNLDDLINQSVGSIQAVDVSLEDLQEKQKELESQFKESDQMVECFCPDCGHQFNLLKSDLK